MASDRLKCLLRDHPILVTGMGACTAAGNSVAALWQCVREGRSTAAWLPPGEGMPQARTAGCTASITDHPEIGSRTIRHADRSTQLAVIAAVEAAQQAGLEDAKVPHDRIAIVAGTGRGPAGRWTDAVRQADKRRVRPTLAANCTIANLSGSIAARLGIRGPSLTVSATCASSADAIVVGAQMLLSGASDVVLVGGAESALHPVLLAQFDAAGVLAAHADPRLACRPFDIHRNGTVMGEGAAFLVLESAVHAQQRSARSQGRLAGWGLATEPGQRAGSSECNTGLQQAMSRALAVAEMKPSQVDYLNAHGTGTTHNDLHESRAISEVFAGHPVICSSTKPVTGHCLGATAAMEAIICLCALQSNCLPPTVHCEEQDPACAIRLAPQESTRSELSVALSNSSGFWGNHASLLFTKT